MLKSKKTSAVLACAVPLLVSCVAVMPGEKPGPVPPRMVKGVDGSVTWDNPAAFGRVPPELQARGDAICQVDDLERAIGFHPEAENVDRSRVKGGGYLCTGHAEQEDRKPSPIPPRMINTSDGVTWDHPRAFGAVPESLRATGDAHCRAGGFVHSAGYHPNARDLNGKPIPGGGYFCVHPVAKG